jgi:hypothetical protein
MGIRVYKSHAGMPNIYTRCRPNLLYMHENSCPRINIDLTHGPLDYIYTLLLDICLCVSILYSIIYTSRLVTCDHP